MKKCKFLSCLLAVVMCSSFFSCSVSAETSQKKEDWLYYIPTEMDELISRGKIDICGMRAVELVTGDVLVFPSFRCYDFEGMNGLTYTSYYEHFEDVYKIVAIAKFGKVYSNPKHGTLKRWRGLKDNIKGKINERELYSLRMVGDCNCGFREANYFENVYHTDVIRYNQINTCPPNRKVVYGKKISKILEKVFVGVGLRGDTHVEWELQKRLVGKAFTSYSEFEAWFKNQFRDICGVDFETLIPGTIISVPSFIPDDTWACRPSSGMVVYSVWRNFLEYIKVVCWE